MAVPTAYLTSTKNLTAILDAIKGAQAPERFSTRFLESLGFKSSSDRLIVSLLKALGLLDAGGRPTDRYFAFLDKTRSNRVLAEALREAYADLFQLNVNAQNMSREEVKNKFKTLTEGQASESVIDKMSMTFKALASQADFSQPPGEPPSPEEEVLPPPEQPEYLPPALGGLTYNIQIVLPESRDPAVYEALFRGLKEHLFR